MDWEESTPPPSRESFEKSSSSQAHTQYHNHFHVHRLTTTTSGSATTQSNYTNGSSSSYRIGQHLGLNQAINLSENSKKIGFNSHSHFSSSSANTSPSGSSTSPSPPLILSTSCDSNGSSSNPLQIGTNLTITAASPSQPSPPETTKTSTADLKSPNSNGTTSSKKNKPIPPPLDLSIGAANLSLHSSEPDSSSPTPINLLHSANPIHGSCVTPHFFQPSYYYLGSPRGNPAQEKSLPLRKRWHSWSPLLMNSQIDPMLPLFPDASGNGSNPTTSENRNQDQTPTNATSTLSFSINPPSPWSASTSSTAKSSQSGTANNQPNANIASRSSTKNNSNELQTPTPFYTPNEPSPKFMNSPVFSYSTPDTTLYQGPFSPVRTTTLFPPSLMPSSPFLNSSLNTPTFITNTNGAHTSSNPISSFNSSLSGATLTVPIFNGNGHSTASSSPHSTSSSSSVSTTSYNPVVPSTLLSPASSQASSSNSVSYEDLHEKSTLTSFNNSTKFNPIWNIFIPGTRIRFLHGMNSDWHLVDVLDLKDDYAPNGLELKTLVVTSSTKERIQMTFSPLDPNHPVVEINCEPWHPFMVERKGWCAVHPDIFYETYGMRCQRLECGDVCVKPSLVNQSRKSPQHHHQQMFQSPFQPEDLPYNNIGLRNGFKMPTFNSPTPPPLDIKPSLEQLNIAKSEYKSVSPLAHIPISVVRQKASAVPNPPASSKKKSGNSASSASKKSKMQANSQSEPRGRRPMNAFLLFAKDKRPELIQMYPGKDNRSISVLLGEAWQSLGPVEKEKYASSARTKAEEQKRMHPDCWKRKKAQSSASTSTNNSSNSNNLGAPTHNKSLPSFSPSSMLNFHSHIDEM